MERERASRATRSRSRRRACCMQDFTGVPAVVDLAAMRDAMARDGRRPQQDQPAASRPSSSSTTPCRSTCSAPARAFQRNAELEFERNQERYAFLRWGQGAFDNFKVVPPDTGIVHQVNLEYLARVVFVNDRADRRQAYPDTLVGTDSHTTMVNGLGVLGWGVGGIEAEAAMLGQPMSMLIPQVVGFKLTGELPEGATATDLVLTVTEMLRKHGVVGKFVEFYGAGLANLPLADRATIGNMSPEFGSTCAIFPIDAETLRYLEFTGRPRGADRAGRGVRQGAGPVARRGLARSRRSRDDARARPVDRRAEHRRAQAPAGPRLADRVEGRRSATRSRAICPTRIAEDEAIAESFPASTRSRRTSPTAPATSRGAAPAARRSQRGRRAACRSRSRTGPRRARPRPRRDRRDHELHEHVEPVGDARRRAARAQRGREGPDGQAVGEDVARARLEGRHRVPRPRRPDRVPRGARLHLVGYGCTTCIGNSGPLPDGDLGGRRRQRPRGRLGAVGQPQLRGPHQPRREDELPRLAAAVRRLRARRHDGHRPLRRAARRGRRRRARVPEGHLAERRRGRGDDRGRACSPTCSARATARCSTATSAGTRSRCPTGDRFAWDRRLDVRAQAAVLRGPAAPSPSRSPTSRARACSRCSATASRPTTSRRPARSSATAPPART